MARNLLQDRPTETVMPMSRSTSRAKRASTLAGIMPWTRWVPARSRNASSIDKRLDQRRQRLHGVAHLAADPDIFRHIGADHDGMRAQRQRLEHRHRRAHAEGAGDVAGRRHHAALAAADDHRLVGDLRIVALLDGGIERVAIDVGQRQRGQCCVTDQARGAAGAASSRRDCRDRQGNPGKSRWGRRALARLMSRHVALPMRIGQRLVRRGDVGGMQLRGARQRPSRLRHRAARNPARWPENAGRRRRCAGSPDQFRSRPGTGPAARDRRR